MLETIIYALFSALGYGGANVVSKPLLNHFSILFTLWVRYVIVVTLLVGTLVFLQPQIPQLDELYTTLLVIAPVIGFCGLLCLYKALSLGDVGIITPIYTLNAVVTFVLSYTILQEKLEVIHIIGMAITIIGVMLLTQSSQPKNTLQTKNNTRQSIIYALASAVLLGISFTTISQPVQYYGVLLATTFNEIIIFLLVSFALLISKNFASQIKKINFRIAPFILLSVATALCGAIFQNQSYSQGYVSLAQAVATLSALVSVVGGYIFLKERFRVIQYVGVLVSLIGLSLLLYFS